MTSNSVVLPHRARYSQSVSILPIPETGHVKKVLAAAGKAGLAFVGVQDALGRTTPGADYSLGAKLCFEADGDAYMIATFDRRGYIRQAGGKDLNGTNWVISVRNSRRDPLTPRQALDVLVDFTLPRYYVA